MSLDPFDAERALDAASASRRRLVAAYAPWPWSRHAVFATLMSGLAAAQALPNPYNIVADMGLAFAALGVASLDRRRTGVFVNGWRAGRTQWITLTSLLVATALGLFGFWLSRERGQAWAPLVIGAALFPMGLAASKLWEHVYRGEMEQDL